MDKEFLQWLEQEIADAWEATKDDKTGEKAASIKWVALHSVQEKIKDTLYKEAME